MKIWLDDQLDDPDPDLKEQRWTPEGWVGARNGAEFKSLIEGALKQGEPIEAIDFDNDLGEPVEGYHLVQWLQKEHPEIIELNPNIELRVHSKNNVGEQNLWREIGALKRDYKKLMEIRDLPSPWDSLPEDNETKNKSR